MGWFSVDEPLPEELDYAHARIRTINPVGEDADITGNRTPTVHNATSKS